MDSSCYTNFQNWCLLSNGLYHCQNDFDLSYEWECVYNLQNTTHIPIKNVAKLINKKKIINNILKINQFYKNILNRKISIAILGLNPHCETTDNIS